MMWFLVSIMFVWHKWQLIGTKQPLDISTLCVSIFWFNINHINILTFIGTLIFHRFFCLTEMTPLWCKVLYADEHENEPVGFHFHIVSTPIFSTEHLEDGNKLVRSLRKKNFSCPIDSNRAATCQSYSALTVCDHKSSWLFSNHIGLIYDLQIPIYL